ncbi:DNA-3-methyladenine glycosylase [Ensifer sp. NPDC090286]|uniref:DNA-3-methyladenine glycosylase n=1 Tax=Ensifer sp. NPDC090286 TaxID=3363991 RepID=UPI00383AE6AA
MISSAFFARDAVTVAEDLIGTFLEVDGAGGTIVETEAYLKDDAASHSYRGRTPRNSPMFGSPGTLYVYRSHGLHICLNFVCQTGSAVLVRALEPAIGLEIMRLRRRTSNDRILCAGPGRLCQALEITLGLSGQSLFSSKLRLSAGQNELEVCRGPRIGIRKAVDLPWRFGAQGSRYLSRKFSV